MARPALIYPIFFISGFAAILYQIVWQRALFTIFGTSVESVTLVVTAFMLGLGLGSLAGGTLSRRPGLSRLSAFGVIELAIGGFGAFSLIFFRWVGASTSSARGVEIFAASFAGVLIPTLFMGSTLPLLVAHVVERSRNVGRSVSALYFVNTLGSAAGAFAAALWLLGALGQTGTVRLAAGLNLAAGGIILLLAGRRAE